MRLLCLSADCDVLGITESWLSDEILDSEVSIPGYTIVRLDRNRHGGGLALYIRDCLGFEIVPLPVSNIEFLVSRIFLADFSFVFAIFYRPPHQGAILEKRYDAHPPSWLVVLAGQ